MGADFMASWICWPKDKSFEEWQEAAKEAICKLRSWDDLDSPETMENELDPDLVDHYRNDPKSLREMILEHLDQIDDESREVGYGEIGNWGFLVTGGLSWGDVPTDVFDSFNIVNAAVGVLDWPEGEDEAPV